MVILKLGKSTEKLCGLLLLLLSLNCAASVSFWCFTFYVLGSFTCFMFVHIPEVILWNWVAFLKWYYLRSRSWIFTFIPLWHTQPYHWSLEPLWYFYFRKFPYWMFHSVSVIHSKSLSLTNGFGHNSVC